ncbi:IS701 family transposase [Actinokineospora globicatena]|uniref:ISXo8 transposase n=1 Tax=Actinokineospora globicatena TaxID=103729 RepID=A0A9W6QKL9_9PSEU|nr:transposase [Actinokineospora globicatena]GLW90307.1 putative ISXo8 transposase [Actinokineospora globicatena]
MTTLAHHTTRTAGVDEILLAEMCAELFASLPRSDQRTKGAVYVRGLLRAEGRKSIRKLAAVSGGEVSEQGLHHFVSSSTWDWRPIRAALARYVTRTIPVHAWVVRPMITPKAGEHSVGVDRGFSAEAGQVLNAQYAVGVWAASDEGASPVNWRLHLPKPWLDDEDKRSRAAIPVGVAAESMAGCAVSACLETGGFWGLPVRPVVLDARSTEVGGTVRRLQAAGLPLFVRVSASQGLVLAQQALPGRVSGPVSAHQLMAEVRHLRRPVHVPGSRSGRHSAATVPVRLPGTGREGRELLLVGHWDGRGGPVGYWLTDITSASLSTLVGLSRLVAGVDDNFDRITDRTGIRDYVGRSYDGWHRHVTLASAAHAVAALSEVAFDRYAS